MRVVWRAVVALLVIVAPALWFSTIEVEGVNAADDLARSAGLAQINNDDPEELCKSPNPRKQKKCRYNGWGNGNWRDLDNENENDAPVAMVPVTTVASTPSGLTVELSGSHDWPDPNTPLTISVKGDGAPIARVSWWSTGPTADNPTGDDMAHFGEQGFDCSGMRPCVSTWTVTPRHNGYYSVYARVRDISGQEIQTVWRFTAGEPPR
jgi:hypothetical protein